MEQLVRLSHLFQPDSMLLDLSARNGRAAIAELTQQLHQTGRLANVRAARKDIAAREAQGTTALGHGVAVPHALTPGVNQPLIAYGRSRDGIDFGAPDGKPVHHVFLLLGPPARQPLHLRILARLTRLLADPRFRDHLLSVHDPEEALGAVQQHVGALDDFPEPAGMPHVLVIGDNECAVAMAAHIALLGSRVHLWGLEPSSLETIRIMRGITAEGAISGFAQFAHVGGTLEEAMESTDLIMLALPADLHHLLPARLAPHLREGQAIVLHPGRLGGTLAFAAGFAALGLAPPVYLAEAQFIPYECEFSGPAVIHVQRVYSSIPVATLPTFRLPDLLPLLSSALPYYVPGRNALSVGLDNVATFFQPAIMILNASWIERRRSRFSFYRDGVSPTMARVLEALDGERTAVLAATGVTPESAKDILHRMFDSPGETLHDVIQNTMPYRERPAPKRLEHSFLTECVPCGLVPLVALGQLLGVRTPTAESLIHLAETLLGRDFRTTGRTVERLGLAGKDAAALRRALEFGNGA